jgi:hypothetical protein
MHTTRVLYLVRSCHDQKIYLSGILRISKNLLIRQLLSLFRVTGILPVTFLNANLVVPIVSRLEDVSSQD